MKYTGLSLEEVEIRQLKYGRNEIISKKKHRIWRVLKHVLKEPIYLLLFLSAIAYNILGSPLDGAVMIGFVFIVVSIDVFQDIRTSNTLKKLQSMTEPKVAVIRDGVECFVDGAELVPGDHVVLQEGVKIPADGYLIESLGLKLDESIITGEVQGIWKEALVESKNQNSYCYYGTMVLLGKGILVVDEIGEQTQYGQVVSAISTEEITTSLLEQQISRVAFLCTIAAIFLFIIVTSATYFNLPNKTFTERVIQSLLAGTVLALSMVPGEFPVIKSVFLTMGALRMAKKSALVRKLSAIERLGGITCLCIDKTGTVTENKLRVNEVWLKSDNLINFCRVIQRMGNRNSYDPLDQSILSYCNQLCETCDHKGKNMDCGKKWDKATLIKEYPFNQNVKATGLVWKTEDFYYISVKGSPESIIQLCNLNLIEKKEVEEQVSKFTKKGLRIIGFGELVIEREEDIPDSLIECNLKFVGLMALEDPPRKGMEQYLKDCYQTGIRICMITGDHPETALAIGKLIGMNLGTEIITGDEIERIEQNELIEKVKYCNVYARVLPIHKMKIIDALQKSGEVVAMTGDGVNDSAALSMADVGIAMGKDGAEICRETADVILLDNNFATIVDTIWDGRRIYQNIMKTVGYVLAIHTPIALISLISPLLRISSEELMLLPMHIILLELVMNPVCSIILERQPLDKEKLLMEGSNPAGEFLSKRLIVKSFIQGIVIFIVSFFLYCSLKSFYTPAIARTAGFAVLVLANILLVLVNSSDYSTALQTLWKIRKDRWVIGVNSIIIGGLFLLIYSPIKHWFGFVSLTFPIIIIVIIMSFFSVCWYEIVKIVKKCNHCK